MSGGVSYAPPPGQILELSAEEVRDFRGGNPARLRGTIRVTPAKGRCVYVTRDPDEPDDYVCKPTSLAFSLGDIDRDGVLTWRVDKVPVSWPTPYRIVITTPFGKTDKDPPVYRFARSCTALADDTGRRIRLALFGGEVWTIRFPESDKLLSQPPPIPNLTLVTSGGKVSVADAAAKKDPPKPGDTAPAPAPTPAGAHGPAPAPAPAQADAHAAAPSPEPAPPKRRDPHEVPLQSEDRAIWSIPRRDAYAMNGSYFQPYGSVAGRIKGECRYHFAASPTDPGTGRLECFEVDGFAHVLIPLTCLGQIGPR